MKKAGILLIIIFVAIMTVFLLQRKFNKASFSLKPITMEQGGISFEATPVNFDLKAPKFNVTFTTHSGSMDFDVGKISTLEDDLGNTYSASEWQGPGPGGHHIAGTLSFPAIKKDAKEIKLTVGDGKALQPFIFVWNLNK